MADVLPTFYTKSEKDLVILLLCVWLYYFVHGKQNIPRKKDYWYFIGKLLLNSKQVKWDKLSIGPYNLPIYLKQVRWKCSLENSLSQSSFKAHCKTRSPFQFFFWNFFPYILGSLSHLVFPVHIHLFSTQGFCSYYCKILHIW